EVTGIMQFPVGTDIVLPCDFIDLSIELIAPLAIEEGSNFSIRVGGRTVGYGVVGSIFE
ncbi:elongation factor Tu, partial [Bacillus cereus]|nr:elongation factor Tu [Bacillus cereus]